MLTIHCPPVYGENYPEFNEDAYFVNSFKMSKMSSRILKVADKIITELESGSGCVVLKNAYNGDSINRSKSVLLNVCRHIGWPVSQTPAPKFIEEITFRKTNNKISEKAGYRSRASMPLHTDRCDLNVLFCHTQAKSGGCTRVVSSIKLYDKIKKHMSQSNLDAMESYFPFSRHGENAEGESCFYLSKIFHSSARRSEFVAHYIRCFIENNSMTKAYALSESMINLLDLIDDYAKDDDVGFSLRLCKGDVLFLNSHTTLHSREEYSDTESERLLLRMWLSHPLSRALPDDFLHKFKNLSPGSYRGGIWGSEDVRLFYEEQFLQARIR